MDDERPTWSSSRALAHLANHREPTPEEMEARLAFMREEAARLSAEAAKDAAVSKEPKP